MRYEQPTKETLAERSVKEHASSEIALTGAIHGDKSGGAGEAVQQRRAVSAKRNAVLAVCAVEEAARGADRAVKGGVGLGAGEAIGDQRGAEGTLGAGWVDE